MQNKNERNGNSREPEIILHLIYLSKLIFITVKLNVH
jgi:hypothetical protein